MVEIFSDLLNIGDLGVDIFCSNLILAFVACVIQMIVGRTVLHLNAHS